MFRSSADVAVSVRRLGQEGFTPVRMVMQRQPDGRWLIDDLRGEDNTSMKADTPRAPAGSWSEGD